ncbi:type II/IV secretion system ATP hydrolase [Vibrio sp. JCM 19236]|nr:type II/IV secretion system ATP hydrolase [Vibrio sp. JCM 19236]
MKNEYLHRYYSGFRDALYEALDFESLEEADDVALRTSIDNFVNNHIVTNNISVSSEIAKKISYYLFCDITGLGFLEDLLQDVTISEIMVNGKDDIFIERKGKVVKSDIQFVSEDQLLGVAKNIANKVGRKVDSSTPLCDARLLDGSRVNIVIPPIGLNGTTITIRKFKKTV